MTFWTKFSQDFWSKTEKQKITFEFCIFESVFSPNFSLNLQFWIWTKYAQQICCVYIWYTHTPNYNVAWPSWITERILKRVLKSLENILLKTGKLQVNRKKKVWWKKAIPRRFSEVNVIILNELNIHVLTFKEMHAFTKFSEKHNHNLAKVCRVKWTDVLTCPKLGKWLKSLARS